jgi:hypothetical protein
MVDTKFGVFIIESLSFKNENDGVSDGHILAQILDLCKVPNRYTYLRTEQELIEIIKEFQESKFRYLHLSCHGDKEQINLTLDSLFYYELAEILGPYLKSRRLFISSCEVTNFNFAKEFIPKYRCFSVIGSPIKIEFSRAAVFWSSFYYLMNEANDVEMRQPDLIKVINRLSDAFNLPVNYYSFLKGNIGEIKEITIEPKKEIIILKRTVDLH